METDVIIIGGGAAGLACAVRLSEYGKLKTTVVEAGERLGRKLAATGNGQGNLSNLDMTRRHYHGGNRSLAEKIACADPYAGARLFDLLFTADERGRIYPAGKQASALVDELMRKICGKVELRTATRAVKIERTPRKGRGFTVALSDGDKLTADFVVLAAGGKAAKQFLTDGTAYKLATDLGHTLTPLYPSLVQVKTETVSIKTLKGIRADCLVTAFWKGREIGRERGDVIFTDYGVSGNAVFSISSVVTDKPGAILSLEFLPDIPAGTIVEILSRRRRAGCAERELLSGSLHNQIGRAIIARAGGGDEAILNTLKNFVLPVTGTLGFDSAQVTRGGVAMSEVTDELESKLAKNLFLAGEILDVDGDCGGYNLQWAFTSGAAVADAILKRL